MTFQRQISATRPDAPQTTRLSAYATTASGWDDCTWDDYYDPDVDLDLQADGENAATSLHEGERQMSGERVGVEL